MPSNTTNASYGYVGQHQKLTEGFFFLTPIQMGARLYLPTVGRFTQVDPIEGGVDNNYVYPGDPVNEGDLSGNKTQRGKQNYKKVDFSNLKEQRIQTLANKKGRTKGETVELKKLLSERKVMQKLQQKGLGLRPSRQTKDLKTKGFTMGVEKSNTEFLLIDLFLNMGPLRNSPLAGGRHRTVY